MSKNIKNVVAQGEKVTVFEKVSEEERFTKYNANGTVKHGPAIGKGTFIGWATTKGGLNSITDFSVCTIKMDNGNLLNWSSDYVVIDNEEKS